MNLFLLLVQVLTAGQMRVGWARPGCLPDQELGSDDQAFVFDGFKVAGCFFALHIQFVQFLGTAVEPFFFSFLFFQVQRWHQGNEHFGRAWQTGDVVGCMVDLNEHTMMFTLNGEVLLDDSGSELAFKDFEVGEGQCYVIDKDTCNWRQLYILYILSLYIQYIYIQ